MTHGARDESEQLMGWQFRKSVNLGPLRLNLGKRGVGVSVGAGPIRIGRSATGRRYRSIRIPGTGISHRTTTGQDKRSGLGCCVFLGTAISLLGLGVASIANLHL